MRTDQRHVLNLSGSLDLPRRFQASFSVSFYSRPPFLAYVNGVDFNGDGTQNDLLPGIRVNQFNRGLDKADLASLVERYNQQFANKTDPGRTNRAALTLPANFGFNDAFFTQDLRLSRTFSLGSERVRLVMFGEVFNLLNIANLVQLWRQHRKPGGVRPARRAVHSGFRLRRPESVSVGNESEFLKGGCSGGSANRPWNF